MNLLKANYIEHIVAFGSIPYEILTHQQKVSLLSNFDFDINRIFNADIKQIRSILKKKKSFELNFKEYYIKAKEIIKKKNFLTIDSKYFPFDCWKSEDKSNFKQCQLLPFVLFYEGNPQILNQPKISIVGTRNPDEISIDFTNHVVSNLRKVVVSGFANGIDHYAHLFAISNDIPTIAVFGCGVNIIYPKSNLELYKRLNGKEYLILSEFPNDTIPKKYYFPIRNRIIAALGEKLLCVQAGKKSGALITTKYAKELNKKIYVFYPTELNGFEGNKNLYLSNEASLLFGVHDGKYYVKNPSSLLENIEKKSLDLEETIMGKGSTKNESDEVEFQYKDDSNDFALFKEIFDYPNRTLEYYTQKIGKDVRNIILSYESLLSKNYIKSDKSNRIYPNYSQNVINLIAK